jgi:fatty-acyl-CoA synthase
VASVSGVRPGNVIAFGIEGRRGKEGIVVVAESKIDDLDAVHEEVVDRVCAAIGVPPREVVLVRAGSLPKTSSGKLQRSRCRDQYLDDALAGP